MPSLPDSVALTRGIYREAIQVHWDTTRELLTALDPDTLNELRIMMGLGDHPLQSDEYEAVLDDLTQKLYLSDRMTCFPKFMDTVNLLHSLHRGGDMR